MRLNTTSLAGQLLAEYVNGSNVSSIAALTGLSEQSVLIRLCAGSRVGGSNTELFVDGEGGLGVQWRYVSWRA